MKKRMVKYSFPAVIVIFIAVICFYGIENSIINVKDIGESKVELNSKESEYAEKHGEIKIYVDEDLRYLTGKGKKGFLQEYMNDILSVSGMKTSIVKTEEDADCRIAVITDDIRENSDEINYTSPVLQIEGALFIYDGKEKVKADQGVMMDNRIEKGKSVYHDGEAIEFRHAENASEAVKTAVKENLQFILGDKYALLDALEEYGGYIPLEDEIYDKNVCLLTDKDDTALHGILNKCIYSADRHYLSYMNSQKWLDGTGPVYMKDSYEDLYMLVFIILASVMIVFFIYYQANKNLYAELNDRMEKLAESKKELKTTFNGVGYFMAELDLDGGIIDINRAFYDAVHCDISNRRIWEVMDLDDENREALIKMIRNSGMSEKAESRELISKRSILETDIFPIENARGTVDKLLFMAKDITGERMAERQMIQDNKMIAVGQLAAGVAHEIRNPLGIIRNYCYVLKNIHDEKTRENAIDHIEKAVDNSGAIINTLLDFSRASSKQRKMIDIEEHIRSLASLNNNIFRKKNIELRIECYETVKAFVIPESLDMILINLISNATDAMDDNGILTIKVIKYKQNFEIHVQDTGTGIKKEILQEIFNPFFTTKGSNEGNGLGLYIVYNETEKLNGKIEVESREGEGSVFMLTLPLGDEAEEGTNDQGKSQDTCSR